MNIDKRLQEIIGIFAILVSIMMFMALINYNSGDISLYFSNKSVNNIIGPLGVLMSHYFRFILGLSSYTIVVIFFTAGISLLRNGFSPKVIEKVCSLSFLTITLSALISLFIKESYHYSGGFIGISLVNFLENYIGVAGTYSVIIILNLISLILLGFVSISAIFDYFKDKKNMQSLKDTLKLLKSKKKENEIPLNSISEKLDHREDRGTKKKLPWITKKKVIVYEVEESYSPEPPIPMIRLLESSGNNDLEEIHIPGEDELYSMEIKDPIVINKGDQIESYAELSSNGNEIIAEVMLKDEDVIEEDIIEEIEVEEETTGQNFDENRDSNIIAHEDNKNREELLDEVVIRDHSDDEPIKNIMETGDDDEEELDIDDEEEVTENDKHVFGEIELQSDYIIPTAFLNSSTPIDSESWRNEIMKNSKLLVNTLADFGIESKVINVNRGPVITLYELQIAPGIKVTRIVSLADDIAMALAAYRVRIIAPIPGKSAIGVEIPNKERENVTLGDIIKYDDYQLKSGILNVALGKDILGKPIILDLKRLPHLLIAGATGAGKSVCVNSIITSLIYNYDPNYVRFILVDPKMVELQLYNGLPHLLTPVIIEPHVAPGAMKWAIFEMERRYRLLSFMQTRDIEKYNEKIEMEGSDYEKLPYIVIIIDELADLMMVASKEIEGYITRIAQKARAVGIHMVLATQRPSVDIITGIIKANFPARIAFQVPQKTDSRTIIDQNGAEKLLGRGDMLYQSPTTSFPVRIQGAFISEDEINKIVKHLSKMGEPNYIDIEASLFQFEEDEKDLDSGGDELFVEALKIIEETRKASASYLQRRLSIGYNRAARMIEMMEEMGYVGPQQGSKPREVYI